MFDKTLLEYFPKDPGVYLMKDERAHVIYVGKAKNIQTRVKQYFSTSQDDRPYVPFLVQKVKTIETIVVSSEKEALLLENTLIKKYKPKYNILLKDDKGYVSLKLTHDSWPMVQLVRYKGKPPNDGTYFGPYLNALEAKTLLDLLQHTFPLRQCSDREFALRTRPCILYQMKRCIAPCCNKCTQEEYAVHVKRTSQFLKGQDKELLQNLYKEMEVCSEFLEFEKAAEIFRAIKYIEHALESQQVTRIERIDMDAIGIYREGSEVTLCQLLFREGKLTSLEVFQFSNILQDDEELISSFLIQHYLTQENAPFEILLPIPLIESTSLEEILSHEKKHKIVLHTPKRGDKLALIEMAYKNAQSSFHKEKDNKAIRQKNLLDMQEKLLLEHYPHRIECFDNSHLSGTDSVGCMVVFIEAEKKTAFYRKYLLKATNSSDDYGAMYEILLRRYSKAKKEDTLPNLVIIDGGKGHLNVAKKVFTDLNIIGVDLIAIAKEEHRHDKGSSQEVIFLVNRKDPILLNRSSSLLFLLQQIRDEAHRFAITFHRAKRSKKMISSVLSTIPGIGPVKQKLLLKTFGSTKQLMLAETESLMQIKGLSSKDVEAISHWKQHRENSH
ncbi:MAG: excinuclease ABC subunit UvrC [Chlamydiales bacterium]|nr:excinuclease ABC subunit UvrC [Chlamydiales bacterium]